MLAWKQTFFIFDIWRSAISLSHKLHMQRIAAWAAGCGFHG